MISAMVFALLHNFSSVPYAFIAGLVLGVQFWRAASLWPSLITHSTVNSISILDWQCLTGRWNPSAIELPLLTPALIASILIALCTAALMYLLREKATEAK